MLGITKIASKYREALIMNCVSIQDKEDHKRDIEATKYFITKDFFYSQIAATKMRRHRNNAGIGLSAEEYIKAFNL